MRMVPIGVDVVLSLFCVTARKMRKRKISPGTIGKQCNRLRSLVRSEVGGTQNPQEFWIVQTPFIFILFFPNLLKIS